MRGKKKESRENKEIMGRFVVPGWREKE